MAREGSGGRGRPRPGWVEPGRSAVAVSLARNQGDEHPSTKDVMTTYEHLSNSLPMSGEGGGEAAAASS